MIRIHKKHHGWYFHGRFQWGYRREMYKKRLTIIRIHGKFQGKLIILPFSTCHFFIFKSIKNNLVIPQTFYISGNLYRLFDSICRQHRKKQRKKYIQ